MSTRKKKSLKGHEWRHIENKKLLYSVYFILRLSVVLMLVAQFFNRNFENVLLCVLTLVLFMLPSMFERRLHIDLPDTLEIIILLFIYAAEILGEIQLLYQLSRLGHHAAHHERLPLRRHRLRLGGYPQPGGEGVPPPVPLLHGGHRLLLLHDHRSALGIL